MRQAALFSLKHIDMDHQVWLVLGWEIQIDDQPWKMSVCADLTSACWVPCKLTQNLGPFPVYVMDFHFQQKKRKQKERSCCSFHSIHGTLHDLQLNTYQVILYILYIHIKFVPLSYISAFFDSLHVHSQPHLWLVFL